MTKSIVATVEFDEKRGFPTFYLRQESGTTPAAEWRIERVTKRGDGE